MLHHARTQHLLRGRSCSRQTQAAGPIQARSGAGGDALRRLACAQPSVFQKSTCATAPCHPPVTGTASPRHGPLQLQAQADAASEICSIARQGRTANGASGHGDCSNQQAHSHAHAQVTGHSPGARRPPSASHTRRLPTGAHWAHRARVPQPYHHLGRGSVPPPRNAPNLHLSSLASLS